MLSREQERKIKERLDWLDKDEEFQEKTLPIWPVRLPLHTVEVALRRFEEEKVAITQKGRFQEHCAELVRSADDFFKPYGTEIQQLGVSYYRFAMRCLEDHLGEDAAFREFTVNQNRLKHSLTQMFDAVRLLVLDGSERKIQ